MTASHSVNRFRRFPYTAATLALAVVVTSAAVLGHINVFELSRINLIGIEGTESAGVLITVLLVIPAFFIDRINRQHGNETERVIFALAVARVAVWEWDLKSDAVTWSHTTEVGLNLEDAPTSGRAFLARVHPDDRAGLGAATGRSMHDGIHLKMEYRVLSADGVPRWMEAHVRTAYDEHRKPVQLVGVNIDIDDRKTLESQLQQAYHQAERLRVLRTTTINNNLNQLQLLRLEVNDQVSNATLTHFDSIIQDTVAQLTALGKKRRFADLIAPIPAV